MTINNQLYIVHDNQTVQYTVVVMCKNAVHEL